MKSCVQDRSVKDVPISHDSRGNECVKCIVFNNNLQMPYSIYTTLSKKLKNRTVVFAMLRETKFLNTVDQICKQSKTRNFFIRIMLTLFFVIANFHVEKQMMVSHYRCRKKKVGGNSELNSMISIGSARRRPPVWLCSFAKRIIK